MAKVKDPKNKKHFFKDFKAELKKVIWPTPNQVFKNTVAVITIVLVTAAIVFVLDLAFETFNERGINRLKANIKNRVVIENTATEETNQIEATENSVSVESNENVQ